MYAFGILLLSLVIIVLLAKRAKINPDLTKYYPPKILSHAEDLSIQVPVVIEPKDGKEAFVELFELYGFSGNGPSIAQVIRKNTNFKAVTYDCEGDCFLMYAKDSRQFVQIMDKLKCIENIECLNDWLRKSFWCF